MSAANKVKALGVALGLALFVAVGLIVFVAAESKPLGASMKEGPIDPVVVAPGGEAVFTEPPAATGEDASLLC